MAASPGWQSALLTALHAPATPANLQFVNAWQRAEGGSAAYNPFNTTQSAPGASSYNPVGVRNYPTAQAGIQATVQTLLNGRYAPIVTGLRSGHESARQLAEAVAASPWGTGQGVLRVLGSSPAAAGGAPASPSPAAVAPTPTPAAAGIPLAVQQILNQNNERAGIAPVNYGAAATTAPPRMLPGGVKVQVDHPGPVSPNAPNVIRIAEKYLNTPYKWGGADPSTGFDCSGLVQYAYKQVGINVPRTSQEQFKTGSPVARGQLKPGDVVFFVGSDGTRTAPGHEGLYIGHGQFVQAPHTGDVVKISRLADYMGSYVGARRLG